MFKDYSLAPKQTCPTLTLGMPLPVWDRNKGAIMAAEGALVRASEEPHRVEMNLTNTLAAAYMNYKNNLEALEYYRRYILPDQVRAYRGAYDRRQIDPNASFGDVVSAQQTLAADVTTYLQTLGQVWTSVTSVADLIQTDDLFEFARPRPCRRCPIWNSCRRCLVVIPGAPPPGAGAAASAGVAAPFPHRSPSRRLNPSSVQFQMLRPTMATWCPRPVVREVEETIMVRLTLIFIVLAASSGAISVPAGAQALLAERGQASPGLAGSTEPDPLPGLPRPPDQPNSLFQPAPAAARLYGCPDLECPYFERDPLLESMAWPARLALRRGNGHPGDPCHQPPGREYHSADLRRRWRSERADGHSQLDRFAPL